MKFLITFLLATVVIAQNAVDVGDYYDEISTYFRVTGGSKVKHRTVPSFVALRIFFDHGLRTCGGFLGPTADRIVTAANCVFDCSEGKTNKIKFAFGQSYNFKRSKIFFKDIYRVTSYDASSNTSANDLAVIILNSPVKTNKKVAVATPSTQSAVNFFVNDNLFTCGFGDLDNYRNRTRKLRCTTLRVVPVAECATPAIPGTICTKNVDTRNVCGGDFGDPAYSNSSGTLQAVGVVSFYPDSRSNARCQDGHYVVLTQLGNFQTFLADPITVGTNLP